MKNNLEADYFNWKNLSELLGLAKSILIAILTFASTFDWATKLSKLNLIRFRLNFNLIKLITLNNRIVLSPLQVHLTIHQLPLLPYGSSYSCVFNDKISTSASLVSNGLTCATPELSERPIIESGADHVTMRLAVKASTSDTAFIQRTFAFYDCNVHKT